MVVALLRPALSPPSPLARWECVTELTIELDAWVTDDDIGVIVEAGPLAALPFVGTPLSARQRITKLTIVTPSPMFYVIPAVAISSLALYLPRQRSCTCISAAWFIGVEALVGLRRLTVDEPPNDIGLDVDRGDGLYEAGARSVGMLPALEELVIAEYCFGSLGEFYTLLDVLQASLKHLCFRGPNYESILDSAFAVELHMGAGKGGDTGDTRTGDGGGTNLSSGASDLVVRDFDFNGGMEVLTEVAHRLRRAGRLGPRVTRLRLLNLVVTSHSLAASEVPNPEGVLRELRSGCEAVEFRRLELESGMAEEEDDDAAFQAQEEDGLGVALKAAKLFGPPARIRVCCGSSTSSYLEVDTSALGAASSSVARAPQQGLWTEAARAGPSAGPQLPGPAALLDAAVGSLLEAGRGKALVEASEAGTQPGPSTRSPTAVLLAHGSVVGGATGDDVEPVLAELSQVIRALAPSRHHFMIWPLLPASAMLLAVSESAVEPVKEAVEAMAARMARDVEVVRVGSSWNVTGNLRSLLPLTQTVQSALDAAAPHLAFGTCLEWLHGIKMMMLGLPGEMRLGE
ncbi:hypothetical protein HYH03_004613 [Edaphochlamys debaryana]|uniref:Uncharacterized protein n=1 Tax=Edaphochlamys debaryana TaxID=47281 RepID=A0A836C359_9CHLO|nr:hypothetical protein HYH03_004613 [Edaphochlamys debaryana]|eukprot:KAG2497458.1 hypothetical protein HYH03_004613 [Edaphochlamys debaryana]